jgi:polysaccharide biosynthesis/export protein
MKSFIYISFSLLLFSCTASKPVAISNYLQNYTDSSGKILVNMPEPVIRKNDLLSIRVFSASTDSKTDIPYNLPDQVASPTAAGSISNSTPNSGGVLVDMNGNIQYPHVGSIHAEGLTRIELSETIRTKLLDQLKDPTVLVRFLNFRVTVLGEVREPGSFTVPTERVTILEGLGLAGDITEYGNRNSVKVARDNNGTIEVGTVDLTTNKLFGSPFFRLQQNDVVIVEQTRTKAEKEAQRENIQNVGTRIGIVTSLITTVAILFNVLK